MSGEVRASHLLVQHQGSRRPASWRDPDGTHITKKTKEAARDELLAYKEQIDTNVVSFAELAAKVSDCSSAKRGGDLGFFGPGKMQKAFEVREVWVRGTTHPTVSQDEDVHQRLEFSVGTHQCFLFRQSLTVPIHPLASPRTARTRSRLVKCPTSWIPTRVCTSSCAPRRVGERREVFFVKSSCRSPKNARISFG